MTEDGIPDGRNYENAAETQRDADALKEHVARLTAELNFYHDNVGLAPPSCHGVDLPQWMTSADVMSPLFMAYDARIEELGNLMEQQGAHLDALTERTKQLLAENQHLRNTLANRIESLVQKELSNDKENPESGTKHQESSDAESQERVRQQAAENNLLTHQTMLLKEELDRANDEISKRDQSITSMDQQISNKIEVVKHLEQKISSVISEKRACEEKLSQTISERNGRDENIKKLKAEIRRCNRAQSDLIAKIEELSTERTELETEAEQLTQKISILVSRTNDLQSQLQHKTREADVLGEKYRKIGRELDTAKKDVQGMLKMVSAMEKKLCDHAKREKDSNITDCRAKLDDALLARDKLEATCASLRKRIESLNEQREEDARRLMQEQASSIDALKLKHVDELQMKERIIQDLSMQNVKIQSAAEHDSREKSSVEEKFQTLTKTVEERRTGMKDRLDELKRQLMQAQLEADLHSNSRTELERKVVDMQKRLDETEAECSAKRSDLSTVQQDVETKTKEYHELYQSFVVEREKAKRGLLCLQTRMEENMREMEQQQQQELREKDIELEQLHGSLEKSQASSKESSSMREEQESRHEAEIRRHEAEKKDLLRRHDNIMAEERDVSQRLMARNKELNNRINVLSSEKLELNSMVMEHEDRIESLVANLRDAEYKVSELGKQLSESIEEQHERIRQERDARQALRESKIELERMRKTAGIMS